MDVIERLVDAEGTYLGTGTDREGREFRGELEIDSAVEGAGVSLLYTARDDGESPLHQEQMLVGYTRDGNLYLWGLDSSTERIRQHALRETTEGEGGESLRFGIGEPDDESAFCEEIVFEFAGDDVEIEFSRGRPGESLQVYSTARLVPEAFYSIRNESATDEIAYRELEQPPEAPLRGALEEAAARIDGALPPRAATDGAVDSAGPGLHLVVAEVGESVVGFRAARVDGSDILVCDESGVIPDFRDLGVGDELLVRQLRWARERGLRRLQTHLPGDARGPLKRHLDHGFAVVGAVDAGDRATRAVLECDLRDEPP